MATTRPAGARTRHLRVVDDATAAAAEDVAVEAAKEVALRLLAGRARTSSSLRASLVRRGLDPEVVGAALSRLEAVGLLDDEAYARAYAEREAGRRGPRAIADALQRRGVAAPLAHAVAGEADDGDVEAAALAVGRAALPRWRGLEPLVVHRRLTGLLARRGYPSSTVRRVVQVLLAERSSGSSGPADRADGLELLPDSP